jgi:hypothetical protein
MPDGAGARTELEPPQGEKPILRLLRSPSFLALLSFFSGLTLISEAEARGELLSYQGHHVVDTVQEQGGPNHS